MKTATYRNQTSLLRGGRMTKYKGQTASFAPALGRVLTSVSVAAMGTALVFVSSAAWGGSCEDQGGGNFVCSGPANDITPEDTITIQDLVNPITVTTEPGFGINAADDALVIEGGDSVTFTDANAAPIKGAANGIEIRANNGISFTTTGQVEGVNDGINLLNFNAGAIAVDVVDVTSTGADGIRAFNESPATDLSITASGAVTGNQTGIYALNTGSGALTIDVVDVRGENVFGIQAGNYGTDLSITATGAIEAAQDGIFAQNIGTGALTIDVVDVTSTDGDGIDAFSNSQGTDLSITATGEIEAAQTAILAVNAGRGALNIDVADVTSTDGNGIVALSAAQGSDMSITASGPVAAEQLGIYAHHSGSGALTIDAADVSADNDIGIQVRNNGTDLSISASGAIQAALDGLNVDHVGTGAVRIEVADVTSTGDEGIFAYLDSGATGLTLTASGSITAQGDGITVENLGSGATTIDVVDVTSATGEGISVSTSAPGSDLSITSTGTIVAAQSGIRADNRGSGALTIDVNDVTSTDGKGIDAFNRNGTDLTITASGTVSAADTAIEANNDGSGNLTIAVNTVHSDTDYGIEAFNDNEYDSDLLISATGHVSGFKGIFADQGNSGVLNIDVADVTATGAHGILAVSTGSDMSITASGTITAFENGIDAKQRGEGDLTINGADVTGGSEGASGYGIYALGGDETTRMTITSTGHVTGTTGGISAQTDTGDSDMIIDVVDVTATGGNGIQAEHLGADLSITSSGTVTGNQNGISVLQYGSGALTINANNAVGENNIGILAESEGTDISITTTGNVAGLNGGILAVNYGTGVTNVTVSGNVISTNAPAIVATSNTTSRIELLDGAAVEAESGQAIFTGSEDSTLILRDGSRLSGSVAMNAGENTLFIEGGADIAGATLFDGGAGSGDALVFSGFTGSFDSALFNDWESLTAQEGGSLTLEGGDTGPFETIFIDSGAEMIAGDPNFTVNGLLQVNATGRFLAEDAQAGEVAFAETVLNNGLISTADGTSGDRLSFGADLTGNGIIGLDVNLTDGTNDAVFVAGNTAGANQGIDVAKSGSTIDTAQVFTLVTVAGNSNAADFQLINPDFVTNDGFQAISDGEIAYILEHDDTAGTFALTPFGNGEVLLNPGSTFLAAGIEQFSEHLTFGSSLGRVINATQAGAAETQTVSRALHDFSTATHPHFWVQGTGKNSRYSFDDRNVETTTRELRFGAALPLMDMGNGRLIGGFEFATASLSSDVVSTLTSAAIETDAHDLTFSALWISDSQFYTDVQLRYASFDSTITPNGGASVNIDGKGYGASIEIGMPFELKNGLSLIPQAQVMYSDIDVDDIANPGGGGLTGAIADGDNLTARLGLRAEKVFANGSTLFGQLDYSHAFDSTTSVALGTNTVATKRDRDSVALTLGGYVALSPNASLFGEVTGVTGLGGGSGDRSIGGNLGIQFRF